ncbi:MAG: cytochrome c oxidase subunit II [Bacilli bacterium]
MKAGKVRRRTLTYAGLGAAAAVFLTGCGSQFQVLDPAGPVARTELNLIDISVVLILIVIVPVIGLLIYIVYRYRDTPGNKAPYDPHFSDSKVLEFIWWGIPIIIVAILGVVTVRTTVSLAQPPNNASPMTIEVTSLDWKWLFQYPNRQVATVNYAEIPVGVPVQFILTSNAPMNSFWVPRLGGQEYTMPGMALRLWLQANQAGDYYGHGANFTGRGFAHTTFHVVAVPMAKYDQWVKRVKSTAPALTLTGYKKLAIPNVVGDLTYSSYPANSFYNTVMNDGGRFMPTTMQMTAALRHRAGKSS